MGKELTIQEFMEKKKELEGKIASDISFLIEAFRQETKVTPNSIYIEMLDVTNIHHKEKRHVVGNVSVSVDL